MNTKKLKEEGGKRMNSKILDGAENAALSVILEDLVVKMNKTAKPVIVAMIGLVGSGKTTVAQKLAQYIDGTVIPGDDIRVALRERACSYKHARTIAELAAFEVVKQGNHAIIDSDFVDKEKRTSLREKAKKAGIRIVFICAYCAFDVMIQRMREHDPGEFFNKASSSSTAPDRGKDVKIREMLRRIPLHYRWSSKGGGQWAIKKPPCKVIADIDTGDAKWPEEVGKCAQKIRKML